MDLRSLRYFIAVLEAGSLSRAARLLYVAQPALTAQIKKLESELNTQIFDRSHAGVTPTEAGLQLYQDARRLLSDASAMRERLQRAPEGPEGSVTVAMPFLLASLLLGPALARIKNLYPRIRVFVLDDLSLMVRKAMLDRRADIGVLVDLDEVAGLDVRPLAREAMYICGADASGEVKALTRKPRAGGTHREFPFAKVGALPLVLQSRRFTIRAQVEEAAQQLGVELHIAHEHDSARVIRSLYLAGAGFTFTPACALNDAPSTGPHWLVARVVQPEMLRRYYLATPVGREPDAATRAVLEVIVDETRAMIERGHWQAEFLFDASTRRPAAPRKRPHP